MADLSVCVQIETDNEALTTGLVQTILIHTMNPRGFVERLHGFQ